jgi:hypothetical protein
VAPGAREAVVVHDGEGSVIDTSAPADSALFALVRAVRPGTADVVREYWLLVSSDAGQSWTTRSLPAQDALRYVEFSDRDHGWLIGQHGAFSTADGGRSWAPVNTPLQPLLRKNLLRSGDGGAIAFQKGSIEARDAALGILRSNAIGGEASIDCLARIDDARLLAIGRIGPDRAQRAFAREVSWPGLALGAAVAGLPEDFLCDQAATYGGGVVLAGARLGAAGALGISNAVFVLSRDTATLRELKLEATLSAVVLAIGESPQPVIGQVVSASKGKALIISRLRP